MTRKAVESQRVCSRRGVAAMIHVPRTPATSTARAEARDAEYLLVRLLVRPVGHQAQSFAIALWSPATERSSDLIRYSRLHYESTWLRFKENSSESSEFLRAKRHTANRLGKPSKNRAYHMGVTAASASWRIGGRLSGERRRNIIPRYVQMLFGRV